MKRWTLKTKAILLISGVFLGLLLLLVGVLSFQIRSEASKAVALEVDRTWRMYHREQRQRESSLMAVARVIADVPLLGATLDTRDPSTVRGNLEYYRARLGGDLYIATDREGAVLAEVRGKGLPVSPPRSYASDAGVASALRGGSRSGFLTVGTGLYQVATVPVRIGGETQGTLTLGVEVNDAMAREIKSVSDSDISFAVRGRVIASTLDSTGRARLETSLRGMIPPGPDSPKTLDNREDTLTEVAALPASDGAGSGNIIIQQSLSRAIASYHRLLTGMMAAGLCVLALLAGFSVALAESVTGPVLSIAHAARDLASGDWNRRVKVHSRDELYDLAVAFNQMADRLQGWDEELRQEVERRTEDLNSALARLDGAYRQIREFNADAAHELFTPLTIMRGEMEVTLKRERPVEEYRKVLDTLHDEVLRLTRIVEQLLALSRADTEQIEFRREPVPLRRVLRDVCSQFEAAAEEKGLCLRLLEGPDVTLNGDEDRLRQLFLNLIGNAVNYCPPGSSIDLEGSLEGGKVCIRIADTGPGISPEHLPRLFDRFYRVDRARSRKLGGSGLGLAICKWIVENHGGGIRVESEVGEGTAFYVTLPLCGDGVNGGCDGRSDGSRSAPGD